MFKLNYLNHSLEGYQVLGGPSKQLQPYKQTAESKLGSKHSSRYQGIFLLSAKEINHRPWSVLNQPSWVLRSKNFKQHEDAKTFRQILDSLIYTKIQQNLENTMGPCHPTLSLLCPPLEGQIIEQPFLLVFKQALKVGFPYTNSLNFKLNRYRNPGINQRKRRISTNTTTRPVISLENRFITSSK